MARLILICWPETGAVRSQHFVADDDISVFVEAELKFCICDDDAAASCIVCAFFIESDRTVAELCSVLLALAREVFFKMGNALFVRDILVMVADFSLCGRRIDRLRQLIGFF